MFEQGWSTDTITKEPLEEGIPKDSSMCEKLLKQIIRNGHRLRSLLGLSHLSQRANFFPCPLFGILSWTLLVILYPFCFLPSIVYWLSDVFNVRCMQDNQVALTEAAFSDLTKRKKNLSNLPTACKLSHLKRGWTQNLFCNIAKVLNKSSCAQPHKPKTADIQRDARSKVVFYRFISSSLAQCYPLKNSVTEQHRNDKIKFI